MKINPAMAMIINSAGPRPKKDCRCVDLLVNGRDGDVCIRWLVKGEGVVMSEGATADGNVADWWVERGVVGTAFIIDGCKNASAKLL